MTEDTKRKAIAFHEGHLAQIDAQIRQLAEAREFHLQIIAHFRENEDVPA